MMKPLMTASAMIVVMGALAACQPADEETEQVPAVVDQAPLNDAIAAEDLPPDDAIPAEEEVPEEAAPPAPADN